MKIKIRLVWAAAILSVALLAVSTVVCFTFYKIKSLSNVLSVTGSAEKAITSDTVKWVSYFSRSAGGEELKEGSAAMRRDLEMIRNYLKEKGVADGEVKIDSLEVSVVCGNQNEIIYDRLGNQNCSNIKNASYSLKQVITVESDKVEEITALSQAATDYLINQGLIFSTQSLEYYYSGLSDLRLELLAEATKDAKARADIIARSTERQIGDLQAASMGVFQVTAKNSMEVSDYGLYDTSSIEKKVTAVVRASFSLK